MPKERLRVWEQAVSWQKERILADTTKMVFVEALESVAPQLTTKALQAPTTGRSN